MPIGAADTYTATADVMAGLNSSVAAEAFCQPGDVLLGGSCSWPSSTLNVWTTKTEPYLGASQGWKCGGYNSSGTGQTMRATALCYATP